MENKNVSFPRKRESNPEQNMKSKNNVIPNDSEESQPIAAKLSEDESISHSSIHPASSKLHSNEDGPFIHSDKKNNKPKESLNDYYFSEVFNIAFGGNTYSQQSTIGNPQLLTADCELMTGD